MRFFLFGISVALILSLYGVQASETEALPDSEEPLQPIGFFGTVTGSVELGFLLTSGNTDSFAIRANSELVHDLQFFRNKYQLHSLIQKNNVPNSESGEKHRVTTANRYGFSGQSNYKLVTGRESIFGRGSYSYDRFGAFREQATLAAGYGNRLYEQQSSYVDLESGPGFAYQRSAAGNNNSGAIWFLAANMDYAIFDNTRFRQTLEGALSLNGENSTLLSRSSLTAKIVDKLSMRFNFVVRHNSRPEGVLRKTDTETSASLVYTF
jgi:putative salt-induced outer membrane protein YdiY